MGNGNTVRMLASYNYNRWGNRNTVRLDVVHGNSKIHKGFFKFTRKKFGIHWGIELELIISNRIFIFVLYIEHIFIILKMLKNPYFSSKNISKLDLIFGIA